MNKPTCFILAAAFMCGAFAADWPQLGGNPQRTNYTPESVPPLYRQAWTHDFYPERVERAAQPAIYQGKVFVGTKSGNLHALDAATGKEVWTASCAGPIMHSAACGDGIVVVNALNGVFAYDAADGAPAWSFRGDPMYGFSTAPLIADGKVFAAQRGGNLYALNLADGALQWAYTGEVPIFNTPAWDAGKVFFCDETIALRCLDAATGKVLWTSEQLYGQSAKLYHPLIVNGLVILRPMAAWPCVEYQESNADKGLDRPDYVFRESWPSKEIFRAFCDWWNGPAETFTAPAAGTYNYEYYRWLADNIDVKETRAGRLPKPLMDAQEAMLDHFKARPFDQDLFVLDAATGRQAFIAPHFPGLLSLPGNVTPPAYDGRGGIVIPWLLLHPTYARLDLAAGRVTEIMLSADAGPIMPDQTEAVSVGGGMLFMMHAVEWGDAGGHTGVFDMDEKRFYSLSGGGEQRGMLRDNNTVSATHAAAIANGYFYHIVNHDLSAWVGAQGGK